MAKLILSLDGTVIRELALDDGRIRIGRKPHNDLQIDNLAVSGEHAAITTQMGSSLVEDLQSTNGTLVNGELVEKHLLCDGDMIEIGKYKIKYINERSQAAQVADNDFEKTMIIRPGSVPPHRTSPTVPPQPLRPNVAPAMSTPLSAQPVTAKADMTQANVQPVSPAKVDAPADAAPVTVAAEPRTGVITVLTGGNAGRSLELTKNLTSIGKPGAQVAIITRRPNGYFITHVEGPSHPFINGTEIGIRAHELNDNDIIELVGVKMEFSLK